MSNLYKKSMEQMKFSKEFNKNTISKMATVTRSKQSKNKVKVLRVISVAAAVMVIVFGGIFVGHQTAKQNNAVLPLENQTSDPSIAIESPKNMIAPTEANLLLSAKEKIVKQQEYGVVSLCARPTVEIQTLAKRAVANVEATEVSCYEDEQYIYFFSENGAVAGIMAKYMADESNDYPLYTDWVKLSEENAIALAKSALIKYCESYTEDTADRFSVETWYADAGNVQHYIDWRINFKEYTPNGIQRNTIIVEIDTMGNVATIFFGNRSDVSDHELENSEYISEETAILHALDQFKKEGREVDLDHFTVTSDMMEHEGTVVWHLYFEELNNTDGGYAKGRKQIYWMILSANTGEWISTSFAR